MKLTSKRAMELLNKAKDNPNNIRWINHCICVGNAASKIAKALNIDYEFAKTLGYIHDIGKMFKHNANKNACSHAVNGYNYIKSLGYDEIYAGICIKHSFLNNDIDCLSNTSDEIDRTIPDFDFLKNYISKKYSIYEKIINLCDLMCKEKIMTVEKRMIDLLMRHGIFKNTQYHIEETFKLKKYFDDLLGYNLYNLFRSEIIDSTFKNY